MPERDPIIVLGGGFAGMAAAVRLARAGERIVLVEARRMLGGRTRSFFDPSSGDELDNGQHVLIGAYRETLALLETLGTRHLLEEQRSLDIPFRDADGSSDRLRALALPAPLHLIGALLLLRRISLAEKIAVVRAIHGIRSSSAAALEGITAADLLDRFRQSQRLRERFWDPLIIATMNNRAESAAALLFREVLVRGFLSGRAASAILWAKSGLSSLLDPAERLLADAGASIIFGATVDSIHAGDRGVRVVLRGGGEFVSRRVVSALPVFMLREAIRHEPLARALVEDLDRFRPSPIVSIYLWYDRPLALAPMTGMIGTMTQWLFDRRALHGEEGKNGFISAVISAADDAAMTDPDALATRCAHELERALPELGGARVVRAKVIKERAATFLASPDVEPLRPDTESPIPGLFLAGDWTNTGLPASIEGAVLSGTRAGDVVLRQR